MGLHVDAKQKNPVHSQGKAGSEKHSSFRALIKTGQIKIYVCFISVDKNANINV